MWRIG